MTSVQSSLDADPDEVDLSGLVESIVDSDEEEDLAESMDVSITGLSFHSKIHYMYFNCYCNVLEFNSAGSCTRMFRKGPC